MSFNIIQILNAFDNLWYGPQTLFFRSKTITPISTPTFITFISRVKSYIGNSKLISLKITSLYEVGLSNFELNIYK